MPISVPELMARYMQCVETLVDIANYHVDDYNRTDGDAISEARAALETLGLDPYTGKEKTCGRSVHEPGVTDASA